MRELVQHGFQTLCYVAAMAIVVYLFGIWCRRGIEWYCTRILVREAEHEMKITDLGPLPREYFSGRTKHAVCQQPIRIARSENGTVFRYCALCRGGVDQHMAYRLPVVIGIDNHPGFKPRVVAPEPPTAA